MSYKVFVINPGSTSTKLAYFEDEKKLFETSVFHDAPALAAFPTVLDQFPYRKQLILDFIKENKIDLHGVDAIVGRGGSSYAVHSGVYEITDLLIEDTEAGKGGVRHPSNLGPRLAKDLQQIYGGRTFIVDSPMTDEFHDVARITGIPGMYRRSHLHVLNQKGTARFHCSFRNGNQSLRYEDGNFIICHIDGGMSIAAHEHGRMIDGNDGAGGEGPFTPTRVGSVDILDLISYLEEHPLELGELRKQCMTGGGLAAHFGTSNADIIHKMVEEGDPKATRIWNAMIYNICKQIGAMAAVLHGQVDGILCSGGLMRFHDVAEQIRERCGWIAPVSVYPGEFEHEAMAAGAIRVLKGKEKAQTYPGEPVWKGFPDEQE